MSQANKQFGAYVSQPGQDLRVQIGGPGRKSALQTVISYARIIVPPLPVPPVPVAFDDATFYGRLIIFLGIDQLDASQQYTVGTIVPLKTVLDVTFHTPGPFTFLPPLTNLEGNFQSDEGGILNIILCAGIDAVNGQVFTGRLTVGGQTLPYGGGL